jgi:hypothetical protein
MAARVAGSTTVGSSIGQLESSKRLLRNKGIDDRKQRFIERNHVLSGGRCGEIVANVPTIKLHFPLLCLVSLCIGNPKQVGATRLLRSPEMIDRDSDDEMKQWALVGKNLPEQEQPLTVLDRPRMARMEVK